MNDHQVILRILTVLAILLSINNTLQAQQAVSTSKEASYWIKKGDTCAVYGNDKAAIKHYQKALKIEPNNSRILFNLGVSYGEMEQYEEAFNFINKALEIGNQNGLYYYGRGRVFLASGEKEKAIEDFKYAAVLGNRDAQNYLKNTLHLEW